MMGCKLLHFEEDGDECNWNFEKSNRQRKPIYGCCSIKLVDMGAQIPRGARGKLSRMAAKTF